MNPTREERSHNGMRFEIIIYPGMSSYDFTVLAKELRGVYEAFWDIPEAGVDWGEEISDEFTIAHKVNRVFEGNTFVLPYGWTEVDNGYYVRDSEVDEYYDKMYDAQYWDEVNEQASKADAALDALKEGAQ